MPEESFKVYVVDDDPSIRIALNRLLRSVGYQVLSFESAEDFLNSVSSLGDGCLVLDIHLKKTTGFDLLEKLTSMGITYKVIIITAYDTPQWRDRAKMAGVAAYLSKPYGI